MLKSILKSLLIISLIGAIFSFGCTQLIAEEQWDVKITVDGNNAFALDLYSQLKEKDGNLFFSPYSISTALAMTYAGARGNTEKEMADVLHFNLSQGPLHLSFSKLTQNIDSIGDKEDCELNIANSLWFQEGYDFLDEYERVIADDYGANINQVDFKGSSELVRLVINSWVEEETKQKIKDLIAEGILSPLTRLVLANAIYFKGKWASQFEKRATLDTHFTLESGDKVTTPTMRQTADFSYAEEDTLKILEIPYVGDDISMVVFLPNDAGGIKKLEKNFTQDNINLWLRKLHKREVVLALPRFKMTSSFSLKKTLYSMGMIDAFLPDMADFSGMTGKNDLLIGAVLHKAFVEVNEEGTEAAAATAVIMREKGTSKPTPFIVDHPFIFIIRDMHSNSILFCGRVLDPR